MLVSCTDGVGTKLKLAIESGIFDTVGIDLVAMSVNDLICCGAKPLFFLDYIAVNTLIPEQAADIVSGISKGCVKANTALLGGEMAEMSDMYKKGDFDLAGFAVGVVERENIIDGSRISAGDYCYALPSSGLHSNGFSLVRKALTPESRDSLGISMKTLLEPTKIYVKQVLGYLDKGKDITGIAHITGGGIEENFARIMPKTCDASLSKNAVPIPKIFSQIQEAGNIEEAEMYRVFNMGVGMIVVSKDTLDEDAVLIGRIEKGSGRVNLR
ncbi:MAG: phosphoribosylformylglycinamidine cyclo-ligase [Candidatus Margulisbacteria bacterium]|nr:phosphoribosylformylglycinamidine cyclo-ligase [Candidatus Margulisiibacteriota bacterium]